MEELARPTILLVQPLNHLLQVFAHRTVLQQLGCLGLEVLAAGHQHRRLEQLLIQQQLALFLIVLHLHETLDDAVHDLRTVCAQIAAGPIHLYDLENLLDQLGAERLDHRSPPYVQAELADLHHLLVGVAGGRVAELHFGCVFVALDVRVIQILVQIVQVLYALAVFDPGGVITLQQRCVVDHAVGIFGVLRRNLNVEQRFHVILQETLRFGVQPIG